MGSAYINGKSAVTLWENGVATKLGDNSYANSVFVVKKYPPHTNQAYLPQRYAWQRGKTNMQQRHIFS
jgi:hypothetical protein